MTSENAIFNAFLLIIIIIIIILLTLYFVKILYSYIVITFTYLKTTEEFKKKNKTKQKQSSFAPNRSRTPDLSHASPCQFFRATLWNLRTVGKNLSMYHRRPIHCLWFAYMTIIALHFEQFNGMYADVSKITLISNCSKKVERINDAHIFLINYELESERQNLFQKKKINSWHEESFD